MPPRSRNVRVRRYVNSLRRRVKKRMSSLVYRGVGMTSKMPSTYAYKQTVVGSSITSLAISTILQQTAGTVTNVAINFQLADLPQVATFTALYDQYRINKIKFQLLPAASITQQNSTTGVVSNYPMPPSDNNGPGGLYGTVIDYDDSTALSTLAEYLQYMNFKKGNVASLATHTRTFQPSVDMGVLNAAGTVIGGSSKKSPWIDCAYNTIPHYGIKLYIDPCWESGGYEQARQAFRVICTYFLEFKNVR